MIAERKLLRISRFLLSVIQWFPNTGDVARGLREIPPRHSRPSSKVLKDAPKVAAMDRLKRSFPWHRNLGEELERKEY